MTNILKEIRQHLIKNKVVQEKNCKLNFADQSTELVVLWVYGGYNVPVGSSPTIQIKVYDKNAQKAENVCNAVFQAIISDKPNRISTINDKKMKIVESQQPFFVEKDTQQRFVWVFNITVTAF